MHACGGACVHMIRSSCPRDWRRNQSCVPVLSAENSSAKRVTNCRPTPGKLTCARHVTLSDRALEDSTDADVQRLVEEKPPKEWVSTALKKGVNRIK